MVIAKVFDVVTILVSLIALGPARRYTHHHAAAEANVHGTDVACVVSWQRCNCGAVRMEGDTRWMSSAPSWARLTGSNK